MGELNVQLSYLGYIFDGALITLQLTLYGCMLALSMAFIAGLARLSPFMVVRYLGVAYIEFFRGTSIFVQLFWAYFVLPLIGIDLTPFQTGVIALGLNVGAYGAEVVRGAILAVPKEQTEVCVALNMPSFQRMKRIILPQAIPIMLPTFGNNAVELLKGTAVVSLVAISDMTFQAQVVRSQTGNTAIPFTIIIIIYYLISFFISGFIKFLEKKYKKG